MTNDSKREELIEEAASEIDRFLGWKHLRKYAGMSESWMNDLRDAFAHAAFAVFEKAHAPTDDEREQLSREVLSLAVKMRDKADRWANVLGEIALGDEAYAEADLLRQAADALRRSEVPEPQGEPSDAQVSEARDAGKWMHLSIFGNTGCEDKHWWDIMRAALRAAGVVAEEPEWEYGTIRSVIDGWEHGDRYGDGQYIDARSLSDRLNSDRSTVTGVRDLTWAVRRRKAGPWEPVS